MPLILVVCAYVSAVRLKKWMGAPPPLGHPSHVRQLTGLGADLGSAHRKLFNLLSSDRGRLCWILTPPAFNTLHTADDHVNPPPQYLLKGGIFRYYFIIDKGETNIKRGLWGHREEQMISPAAALALQVNIIMAASYCGGSCQTRLRWRFLTGSCGGGESLRPANKDIIPAMVTCLLPELSWH